MTRERDSRREDGDHSDDRADGHGDERLPWTVAESAVEYDTGWYAGGYDEVAQPDGSEKRYYWAALPPAVVVVPLLDGEVVFVEQYRPAIREHCVELPAGIVELAEDADGEESGDDRDDRDGPDNTAGPPRGSFEWATEAGRESYEVAGARELREETGYEPDRVTHLQTTWCSTGVLRHRRGVVVAEGLCEVGQQLDDNEFLSVTTRPRDEALAAAREPPVDDATLTALLLADDEGSL